MKDIKQYLVEGFKLNKNYKKPYNYYPETKDELKDIIKKLIEERGNEANLNDIDTSQITDMSYLFQFSDFNGDISRWNVSNVKDMSYMFAHSIFDGDISKWDVSKVKNTYNMFFDSRFTGENGDISDWNIKKNCLTEDMFYASPLEGKEPKWYRK